MIRTFYLSLFLLTATNLCFAQLSDIKWDYGLNAHFNVDFIKPAVTDTFGNRPGFGGGLMVEGSLYDKFAIQFSPNFSKTSYVNDNTLYINTMSAMDLALDFIYTATKDESVFLSLGAIRAVNLAHVQKKLDGSNTTGLGSTNRLDFDPLDFGLKFGCGIKLSDGVRLNLNYIDFITGTQKKNVIKGRVDYLQFGIQMRFNEFNNSSEIQKKEIIELEEEAVASAHQQLISYNATMVFVLPELKAAGINSNSELWTEEKNQILNNITKAIYSRYKIGNFLVIQPDQIQNLLKFGYAKTIDTSGVVESQKVESPFYIAKIGEFFMENNSSLKWGILLFDSEMDALQPPFPAYVPYRSMDKYFKNEDSVKTMISELNQVLK